MPRRAVVEALIAKARFGAEDRRKHRDPGHEPRQGGARRPRGKRRGQFLPARIRAVDEEGVLLLCLAEALLRIPDAATADRLIAGTIGTGDWSRHLGHSDSCWSMPRPGG